MFAVILFPSCDKKGDRQTFHNFQQQKINERINAILKDTVKVSRNSLEKIVNKSTTDSSKNALYFKISYSFYRKGDSSTFRYWNELSNDFSIQLNDTLRIAESYWDLGNFFYNESVHDSSFYFYNKAHRLYEISDKPIMSGRMLLNMAIIQKNIKDYTGSEVSTIQAISLLKAQNKNYQLFSAYNNLGIIYGELKEYDKALTYHKKASSYAKSSESLKSANLNNIGMIHHNAQSFDDAIKYFYQALAVDSLYSKDPTFYAMLLDNIAFSKLKRRDTTDIESTFFKALKIRDSLNDGLGKVINKIHLAEFYIYKQDIVKAVKYATEAREFAEKNNSFRDLLTSLLLLSKIDAPNAATYMADYVAINDSLIQQERATRNKFFRIRFETDEFIAENEMLYERQGVILAGSATLVFLVFLGYIIRDQRSKNKALLLKQEQQGANEKIYELMLNQHSIKEESRQKERKRISRELHDGIIGRLFGTRMGLGFLNIQGEKEVVEKHKTFMRELQKIEKDVRDISHDLENEIICPHLSFITIIENYLSDKEELGGFETRVVWEKDIAWESIENKILITLYRLMQEALQNILKYARATMVKIDFTRKDSYLTMQINDNGVGFDPAQQTKGIGLKNMETRIVELQGEFFIESSRSLGTRLTFVIPLDEPKSMEKYSDRSKYLHNSNIKSA